MRIDIRNILGIERAEINLPPGGIVEVIGPNASGKSSVAVAAQAVLTQEINPLGAPAPQSKRVYLHDGAEDCEANLVDNGEVVTWRPDRGSMTAPPGIFFSTPEAVGLVDYTARAGAKERAARLQSALLPAPELVIDAIREALKSYLDAEDLNGVMKLISERGWEAAAEVYRDRALQAKRQWRERTAQQWGLKVGADWRPDGWLADYDHLTVPDADEHVVRSRDALAVLHRVQAISETEADNAEKARQSLKALERGLVEMRTEAGPLIAEWEAKDTQVKAHDDAVRRWERALDDMHKTVSCPHCDGPLHIQAGTLVKAEGDQAEARSEIDGQIQSARDICDKAKAERNALAVRLRPINERISNLTTDINIARRAAAVIGTAATPEHNSALAEAEAEVEHAKEVVKMVTGERDARDLHLTIVRYTEAARAIGPEGVRAKMLEKGLTTLNAGLGALSGVAGWPLMVADEKGGLTWSGRPIVLCSESEKWRAQASMQLTLAAITGSRVVVLDRADLLDSQGRVGLYDAIQRVVKATGIAVLLCSTENGGVLADWPIVRIAKGRTS